jgi:hypothetical protein
VERRAISSKFGGLIFFLMLTQAEAGVVFVGSGGDFFNIVELDPSTTTSEENGGILQPRYTVQPNSVVLQMVPFQLPGEYVEANSFIDEDTARVKVSPVGPSIKTAYSGSGAATAILTYSMTVEGNFSGEGDVARGAAEIAGRIGALIAHSFTDSMTVLTDGDFSRAWGGPGMAVFRGSSVVGTGADVLPGFSVEAYRLEASSSGFAKMRTTWTGGRIELTLTQIPEPGTLMLMSPMLAGWSYRRARGFRKR